MVHAMFILGLSFICETNHALINTIMQPNNTSSLA